MSLTVLALNSVPIKQNNFVVNSAIAKTAEENQNAINEPTKQQLIKNLGQIKQDYQAFQSSKQKLINELDRAIQSRTPTKTDVFAEALNNLDLESQSLKAIIEQIENSNLESIKTQLIFVETVKNIREVIEPLAKNSIDSKSKNDPNVIAIQKKLKPEDLNPDGQLGIGTKDKISEFLNAQTTTLLTQVGDLESQITELTTTDPDQNGSSTQGNNNSEIGQLETTIEKSKQANNFFKMFVGILAVFTVANLLALLRIIWLIDNRKKENEEVIKNIDRSFKKINFNINNLQQQINNPRTNGQPSYDSAYDNDSNLCSLDSLRDSLHDLETETENISQNYDNELVVVPEKYPETKLVELYNTEPKSLAQEATKVAIVKDSYYQDRLGGNQAAFLKQDDRKGEFFVLRDGRYEYLFPSTKFKVNQYNLATLEKLFICHGYETSNSGEFKLVKAAIVSSQGEEWILREQGELNFL